MVQTIDSTSGNEMSDRIDAFAWQDTPLGPRDSWPQSLRTSVRLALSTRHPIFVFWGPHHICLYNDAYRPSLGPEKHPSILGMPGAQAWPEIWSIIGPQIEYVMGGQGATWHENALVPIERHGAIQDVYWTYSYGPIDEPGAPNGIGGVLVICTETTDQILAERRKIAEVDYLRKLFDQAPGFMCVMRGPNHVFELANAAYETLAGGRPLLGRPVAEVFPELRGHHVLDKLDRAYSHGERFVASAQPVMLQLPDGSPPYERVLDFVYQPTHDDAGRINGIFCQGADITDSWNAQRALQRSEERQAYLLRLSDTLRSLADPIDIQMAAARTLGEHLGADRVGYAEDGGDGDTVIVTRNYVNGVPPIEGRYRYIDYGAELLRSLAAGATVARPDIANDPSLSAAEKAAHAVLHLGATVNAPLIKDGEPRAILFVHQRVARSWTDDECALIEETAERTWSAVQRARAEAEIQAGEARLSALVRASSDAIYRISADWSERRPLHGRRLMTDAGEPERDWLAQHVAPEDAGALTAAVTAAIASKHAVQAEYRVELAGDGIGWRFLRAIPILGDDGGITEWFAAENDITDRMHADDRLRATRDESERRRRLYEAVTASTPDLIYVFGLDHRFTYANEALLSMWGRTWDDAIGREMLELGYEPWHAAMHDREIEHVIATKQSIRGEVSFPHATLGKREYDYIFGPVLNEHGEVEAVAGTTRDITELRHLSQQKDEFLGIVSHELKTPVTSIKAYTQILHQRFLRADDTSAASMMAKMNVQLNRLTGLIEDLLDVTKIESGQMIFREEAFAFDPLLDEIVELLQHTTERHRILQRGTTRATLHGDRERTGQVITNLLTNAIKYSPSADSIIVTAEPEPNGIRFSVQDFGVGIANEDRKLVFERFFRVSGADQHTYAGLGLGLFITAEIVRRQGGTIHVESELGRGSTFIVRLPNRHKTNRADIHPRAIGHWHA